MTRTGKPYGVGHEERRAHLRAAFEQARRQREEDERFRDDVTKPRWAHPPLVMQVLDSSSGKVQRFFPARTRNGRFR